jgi:hypothetical protein
LAVGFAWLLATVVVSVQLSTSVQDSVFLSRPAMIFMVVVAFSIGAALLWLVGILLFSIWQHIRK